MRLPKMNVLAASRTVTEIFGGYNHNLRIGDGEFYDMKNLTSAYYPILSPRGKRGFITGRRSRTVFSQRTRSAMSTAGRCISVSTR